MTYSLPYTIKIHGEEYNIRDKCDYRVILDVIEVLSAPDLDDQEKLQCALCIFLEKGEVYKLNDPNVAVAEMMKIINLGKDADENDNEQKKPPLMNWQHDFPILAPPISRVLGYDIRMPEKFTHWYTLVGAYSEIGECTFSTVITIRKKKQNGKRLEKYEEAFYRENKDLVDLPTSTQLTSEEEAWLNSDW